MTPRDRVVVRIPLQELWSEDGIIHATRIGSVGAEDIRTLLRSGPIRFVVADVGHPLLWVSEEQSYNFWKYEVACHLPDDKASRLEDFPGEYFYSASRWSGQPPIIVLEKHH